jgi:uncharacterized membrane protein
MLPDPLHPAIVHFPIVLMFVLPVAAAAVLWRLRRGAPRPIWGIVVLTAALVTFSGWLALKTGENEEEKVESVVAEQAIHDHEEAAERFLVVSLIVVALAGLGAAPGVAGRAGRVLALAGSVALVYFGWRVGDLGGRLAYQQGAATAYVVAGTGLPAVERGDDEH